MNGPADSPLARSIPLRAGRPDVIDEAFEGEVTLIHLATGLFYGLDASASAVWLQVRDGRSPSAVIAALAAGYGVEEATLTAPVLAFLTQLRDEQLLVPTEVEAAPVPLIEPGAWAEPQLQRFSDMQDLLLLDPVHDIELDANGWPIPRQQPADGTPA